MDTIQKYYESWIPGTNSVNHGHTINKYSVPYIPGKSIVYHGCQT